MSQLASTLFFSLLLSSLPFLLAGIAVSSFFAAFVNDRQFAAIFPRDRVLGAIVGSLFGLLLPVGQYGTIPIARRFFRQGVPLAVVFSFLVAAPTVNVLTLWLTWQTFADRPSILFYRSIGTWIMALSIGILFSYYREQPQKQTNPESLPRTADKIPPSDEEIELPPSLNDLLYEYQTKPPHRQSWQIPLSLFAANFARETIEFGALLVWGCTIASLFQLWLPQQQLLAQARTPDLQIFGMILLGFTRSVNSSLSALVPGSLTTTLFPGSLIAYLLVSPLINVQGLALLLASFPQKIVLYLAILILLFTLLVSLALSFYIA